MNKKIQYDTKIVRTDWSTLLLEFHVETHLENELSSWQKVIFNLQVW